MTDPLAARTWVLLNFPGASALSIVKGSQRWWRIVAPSSNHSWAVKVILSGPRRHTTEFKAWKAAVRYMHTVSQ